MLRWLRSWELPGEQKPEYDGAERARGGAERSRLNGRVVALGIAQDLSELGTGEPSLRQPETKHFGWVSWRCMPDRSLGFL